MSAVSLVLFFSILVVMACNFLSVDSWILAIFWSMSPVCLAMAVSSAWSTRVLICVLMSVGIEVELVGGMRS